RKQQKNDDYFICPCCGAEVKIGAVVCKECGASDESGWEEDYSWDDELPTGYSSDDDFDYDEFVGEQFPEHASAKRQFKRLILALIVLISCLAVLTYTWMR